MNNEELYRAVLSQGYDDTELMKKIDAINARLDNIETTQKEVQWYIPSPISTNGMTATRFQKFYSRPAGCAAWDLMTFHVGDRRPEYSNNREECRFAPLAFLWGKAGWQASFIENQTRRLEKTILFEGRTSFNFSVNITESSTGIWVDIYEKYGTEWNTYGAIYDFTLSWMPIAF
ncbi:MAG: hypothetical protein AAFO04_25440 [Cyanobacteria bacterium J06592_8]